MEKHWRQKRLEECRTRAVADGWGGPESIRQISHPVVLTLYRPAAEQSAATRHVQSVEHTADEWDDKWGPLWLGHALHAAFLAGVDWERARAAGEEESPWKRQPCCVECGKRFEPFRAGQQYCTRRCRQLVACRRYRRKRKERLERERLAA